MKDVGPFYFVFGEPHGTDKGRYKVYLKFYASERQVMHTSSCSVFNYSKHPLSIFAIDSHTFFMGTSQFLMLDEHWSSVVLSDAHIGREKLGRLLSSQPESQLGKLRTGSPGDFQLKSSDGDLIDVHRNVLVSLWPFFAAAVNADMKEADEKVLELQCPTSTLEVIVRCVYEQDLELEFTDAANLVVVAQMYGLPDLLEIATDTIESPKNSFDELLTVREKSQEAQNKGLKSFCAKHMKSAMVEQKEKIAELPKDDLLDLLMDIVKLDVKK